MAEWPKSTPNGRSGALRIPRKRPFGVVCDPTGDWQVQQKPKMPAQGTRRRPFDVGFGQTPLLDGSQTPALHRLVPTQPHPGKNGARLSTWQHAKRHAAVYMLAEACWRKPACQHISHGNAAAARVSPHSYFGPKHCTIANIATHFNNMKLCHIEPMRTEGTRPC